MTEYAIKANLNAYAIFKLADDGLLALQDYRARLQNEIPHIDWSNHLSPNEQGEYKTQLWDFMSIFGDYCRAGAKIIDGELTIETNNNNNLVTVHKANI